MARNLLYPGNLAVEMFFMISRFDRFWASRFFRLWPIFFLTGMAYQGWWYVNYLYLGRPRPRPGRSPST